MLQFVNNIQSEEIIKKAQDNPHIIVYSEI